MTTSPTTTLTDELLAEIEADYMTAATMRADRDECLMIAAMAAELRTLRAKNESITAIYRMHLETEERQMIELRAKCVYMDEDVERLDWLDTQCEGYGFEGEHEGNRWVMDGPFSTVRHAIDTAMQAQK